MKILNRPCVKNRPVRKGTGRRFSYGSTVSFSEHMRLRAAPQHSARAFGERFFVETRFEKCRCTLCTRKGHAASVRRQSRQRLRNTSNFSNRWIGEKYPAKAEGAMIRCCLSASLPALRGSCRTGPPASGRRPRARRWPCRCGRRRRSRHGERAAWGSSRSDTRQRRRRGRR